MGIYARMMLLAAFVFAALPLAAQLKGEVKKGELVDYAIAAVAITVNGQTADALSGKLTETLRRDLDMTGYFSVLDEKSFIEKPETGFAQVNFKNWLTVGAKGLVKGTATGTDPVELELAFFDVGAAKKVLHKKYKAPQAQIKRAIHSFVRDLGQLLTGEKLKFLSSRIAFIEKTGGAYNLVVADFDGSDKQVVYRSDKILLLPAWSADGSKLFFTSYQKGDPFLYSLEIATKKLSLIADHPGLNTSAAASPDGKNIALRLSKDGNAELYLMNLESKGLTRLTNNMAIDTAPSFSPDGKEISFVSNRSGNPHIYRLFTADPARVERLTEQGNYNQDPDYSADGKYIAFTGRDEYFMFDIFLYDLKSRVINRVTQKQGKNENPSFSPDGRLILFSSDRTGKNAIYISNLKGDKQFLIYKGEGETVTPCWSPELPLVQ